MNFEKVQNLFPVVLCFVWGACNVVSVDGVLVPSSGPATPSAKPTATPKPTVTPKPTSSPTPSPQALAVSSSTLTAATVGTAYIATLAAIGGTGPYTWSLLSGSLPTGLSLGSATGAISGTPTAAASYSFTVQVTDAKLATATKTFSMVVSLASSHQGVTWKSCDRYTAYKTDGFIFNNQRWNGEQGCMNVDTRTAVSWSTDHSNSANCCSSPWVSISYVNNGSAHADNPFSNAVPKLKDIETLKANWRFTVPRPLAVPAWDKQSFHVYFQLYFGTRPGAYDAGDMALVMYDDHFYCQPACNGTPVTIGDRTMIAARKNNTIGPFWVLINSATPDANGVVEIRDFDIKAAINFGIEQGSYSGDLYATQISAAYEVMSLPGGTLTTNDLSFLVKTTGQNPFYLPSWVSSDWAPR